MSHILSQLIKQKLPEWNEIIISEDRFLAACERLRVRIVEWPIRSRGEYIVEDGLPLILLRKGLDDRLRHWVGVHELGHHLLHYPATHRFSKSIHSRMDREANFFAAIALMPTELCRVMTPGEIAGEYDYPKEIIEIRRKISENYQI